jgi:hypothetical protein
MFARVIFFMFLELVNFDVVGNAVIKTFLNVLWSVQEVGGVTLLERVFDVQCQARFAAWQVELSCTNYLTVASVNSNLAVDRVVDVGGGERWVQCQFHAQARYQISTTLQQKIIKK